MFVCLQPAGATAGAGGGNRGSGSAIGKEATHRSAGEDDTFLWRRSGLETAHWKARDSDFLLDWAGGLNVLVRLPLIIPDDESTRSFGEVHLDARKRTLLHEYLPLLQRLDTTDDDDECEHNDASRLAVTEAEAATSENLDAAGDVYGAPVAAAAAVSLVSADVDWCGAAVASENGRIWRVERPCTIAEESRAEALAGVRRTATDTQASVTRAAVAASVGDEEGGDDDDDDDDAGGGGGGEFAWFVVSDVVTSLLSRAVCGPVFADVEHWERQRECVRVQLRVA